jgi:hypothetical protein
MEYCDRGSLETAIANGVFRCPDGVPDHVSMTQILLDVAVGLLHVHEMGLCHQVSR